MPDLATLTAVFSVLQQIVAFLIKYGPGLFADAEAVVADLELAWKTLTSGAPLTVDQQKQIDDALDSANSKLQVAVQAAAISDAEDAAKVEG